jgi:hypothetical protein
MFFYCVLCCVLQKFVSTTLRPTCLPYKELYDWDGVASFLADYITCSPLHPPDELVEQNPYCSLVVYSPLYKPNGDFMDTVLKLFSSFPEQ